MCCPIGLFFHNKKNPYNNIYEYTTDENLSQICQYTRMLLRSQRYMLKLLHISLLFGLQIKSNDIKAGYHRSETIFAGLPGNLEQLLITALDDNGAEWLQKNNFAFPNIQNIQVIHARLSHEHNAGYITERGIMGLYHFIKHCRILQSLSMNLMMENNTLTIAAWQIFLVQGTTNTKRLVLVFSHLPRNLKHLTLVSFVLNHHNFFPLVCWICHTRNK